MTELHDIKKLIDSYFDGSISPPDTLRLLEAADKCSETDGDSSMFADLRMIKALHSPGMAMAEAPVPEGLEERLENHISSLARKPRARFRWLAACSAAAAVAAIVSIGFRMQTASDQPADLTADSVSAMPRLSLSIPEQSPDNATAQHSPASATVSSPRILKASPKPVAKTYSAASVPAIDPPSLPISLSESLPVFDLTPALSLTIDDVRPVIASALIDPGDILAQPISTISQSIDNVYVSLEIVAKALSGSESTLDDAAERLNIASGMRFHDI